MKYAITALLLLGACLFFRNEIKGMFSSKAPLHNAGRDKNGAAGDERPASPVISITARWELPLELQEISGISYLDRDRIACVQDEEGIIFLYNRSTKRIEQKIGFAGPGDYEGIAVVNKAAYVLRSDGKLYEVHDLTSAKPVVKEYTTPLTQKQNIEGLCYDAEGNRLLLAPKGDDPAGKDYKGIYAFDLSTKKLVETPAYRIDLADDQFLSAKGKKKGNGVRPSGIAIHLISRDLYVVDGPKSRLLVMDRTGKVKKWLELGKEFLQPEGIAFSPEGELFISNEGGKGAGNILQVRVK